MFEALSDRLATALRRFSGRGRLTKEDVEVGLARGARGPARG